MFAAHAQRARPMQTAKPASMAAGAARAVRKPPAQSATELAKVYLTDPGRLNPDAAQRLDAMVPDLGPETSGLVDMSPTPAPDSTGHFIDRGHLRPGVSNPNADDEERRRVNKVRVQTSQVLPPPIMGLATIAAAGASFQAYASGSSPAYVAAFGALAAFGAWKLLELRAEALLDADQAQ